MEIRTLEESPEELAAFVNRVWREDYAGRMVAPMWTAEYFDWQLISPDAERRHLLAAYDGGKLVATLLGFTQSFLVARQSLRGLQSSWLTIAPSHRGSGIVRRLKEEQSRRVRDGRGELILSYRYHGTRYSLADKPGTHGDGDSATTVRRVGLWVRLLHPARALRWQSRWTDRSLTRLGTFTLRRLRSDDTAITVRAVDGGDVDSCLNLVRAASRDVPLAIDWNQNTLRHHLLGTNIASGLVGCRGDDVVALLSFHLIPFLDRAEEPLAVMDLLCIDQLSRQEKRGFLLAALTRMRNAGAILALKMGLGDLHHVAMIDSGFVPRSRDSLEVLNWLSPAAKIAPHGKHRVLWR